MANHVLNAVNLLINIELSTNLTVTHANGAVYQLANTELGDIVNENLTKSGLNISVSTEKGRGRNSTNTFF
jgi:hypothetical protein